MRACALTVRPQTEARAPLLYESVMWTEALEIIYVTSLGPLTVAHLTVANVINSK